MDPSTLCSLKVDTGLYSDSTLVLGSVLLYVVFVNLRLSKQNKNFHKIKFLSSQLSELKFCQRFRRFTALNSVGFPLDNPLAADLAFRRGV